MFINVKIPLNTVLQGSSIPDELTVIAGLQPNLKILNGSYGITKPDELIIGHWQFINNVSIDDSIIQRNFEDDSGLRLSWQIKQLANGDSLVAGIVFCTSKTAPIDYNYFDCTKSGSISVFYEPGDSILSRKHQIQIDNFSPSPRYAPLRGRPAPFPKGRGGKAPDYKFILLEGYADYTGTEKQNYYLSKRRTSVIKKYLVSHGIEEEKILIKNHGEFFSEMSVEPPKKTDRKTVLTIYK